MAVPGDRGRGRDTRSRRTLELLALCAASLVPWTVLLAVTLPESREVHQWRSAWVGFNAMMIAAMAATAVLGWRRHRAVFLTGQATAVLLVCDAWFDISLDAGTPDVWASAALAGFVELPLAGFLIVRGYRMLSAPARPALRLGDDLAPPGRAERSETGADAASDGVAGRARCRLPAGSQSERAEPPIRVGVLLGSDRPGRDGERIARWVCDLAAARPGVEGELVDPRDYPLPPPGEPCSSVGDGRRRVPEWAARIAAFDGFVFVVPDQERAGTGRYAGGWDPLYPEWADKAVGFVTYGAAGRAAEPGTVARLRLRAGELMMADVRDQVALTVAAADADDGMAPFKAGVGDHAAMIALLTQVVAWSAALAALRPAGGR